MLENVADAFSNFRSQVGKNQVRISFTHRSNIFNIMAHHRIRHIKVGSGAVGEMADNQTGRLSSMLIYNHKISIIICTAGFHQLHHQHIYQFNTSSNFDAPLLIRCEFGIMSFISLINFFKRELGSREVVTQTLGSSIPAIAYSSST